jgi:hypothetical protein
MSRAEKNEEAQAAYKEFLVIQSSLGEDRNVCVKSLIADSESQFWRRSLIRADFAYLEAICFQLKRLCLTETIIKNAEISIDFSTAELSLLKEETYNIDDNGRAQSSKSKIRTADNLLFAIKMVAKLTSTDVDIDKSSKEWSDFKAAIKIRDRITHPKTALDIEISDNEIRNLQTSIHWVMGKVLSVTGAYVNKIN